MTLPNQPPAPDQAQGPPAPPERGEQMRFMVRIQDNPDLENFNEPLGLFRFQVTPEQIVTDRFDVQREMWIDWPSMIGFTGIGGADDFIEINENEANQLIGRWLDEKGGGEQSAQAGGGSDDPFVAVFGGDPNTEVDAEAIQATQQRISDEVTAEVQGDGGEEEEEEPETPLGERGFQLFGSLRRLAEKEEDDEDDEEDY